MRSTRPGDVSAHPANKSDAHKGRADTQFHAVRPDETAQVETQYDYVSLRDLSPKERERYLEGVFEEIDNMPGDGKIIDLTANFSQQSELLVRVPKETLTNRHVEVAPGGIASADSHGGAPRPEPNAEAVLLRSAFTNFVRSRLPELAPGITDEAMIDFCVAAREAMAEDLERRKRMLEQRCVRHKHPGSRPETDRDFPRICLNCMKVMMGIQKCINEIGWEPYNEPTDAD